MWAWDRIDSRPCAKSPFPRSGLATRTVAGDGSWRTIGSGNVQYGNHAAAMSCKAGGITGWANGQHLMMIHEGVFPVMAGQLRGARNRPFLEEAIERIEGSKASRPMRRGRWVLTGTSLQRRGRSKLRADGAAHAPRLVSHSTLERNLGTRRYVVGWWIPSFVCRCWRN